MNEQADGTREIIPSLPLRGAQCLVVEDAGKMVGVSKFVFLARRLKGQLRK